METQQVQQIKKFIDIAIRRKFLIFACVLIGLAGGLAFYLQQPKSYQSTTLLSYQQQKVNPAQMSPDAQAKIRDVVSTLSQIIMSRTSLEQIIANVGLYKDAIENLPMEDVVEMMRRNIEITPSRQGDTFYIAFSGSEPGQVARVANALAARFIEENLKYREERASETSAYTEDELAMAKVILDKKEAIMRDYKLEYYNEMPEQRANNMSRLSSLQEQYQNRQDSIQDLERTRVLIQDQIAVHRQVAAQSEERRRALRDSSTAPVVETGADQLDRLYNALGILSERYTERHPEIKRIKKQIAYLERTLPPGQKSSQSSQANNQGDVKQFDKDLYDLQVQAKEIGLSIERLNKEKEELATAIEKYEKWVEAAPVRGAEWSSLTREYGELKRHYDFLVAQNLQARSALNLERKQKGSQFKIEDPARVPETPSKPDFLKVIGIALAAGGGLGVAFAFGRELLDASFRDPLDLDSAFPVPVLCTVPYLSLKKEVIKRRVLATFGYLIAIVCLAGIVVAFLYYWKQGRIIF